MCAYTRVGDYSRGVLVSFFLVLQVIHNYEKLEFWNVLLFSITFGVAEDCSVPKMKFDTAPPNFLNFFMKIGNHNRKTIASFFFLRKFLFLLNPPQKTHFLGL